MGTNTVIYTLGNLRLLGYVRCAGDGLYWFTTAERALQGKMELLVGAEDIVDVEDIEGKDGGTK